MAAPVTAKADALKTTVRARSARIRSKAGTIPSSAASDRHRTEFLDLTRTWAAPSMDDVASIGNGIRVTALEGLNGIIPGITYRIIPRSTLANLRKHSDRLPPEPSNRLYQAGKVLGFAMQVFGAEDPAREFLTRDHPMLDGKRPIDVALENAAGADRVINILGRGAYGGGA